MMTTSNEHNNAPAVPQGWPPFDELDDDLIDAACTAGSVLYRVDLMRAYECIRSALLAATPAPAPAQEPYTTIDLGHGKFEVGAGKNGGLPCIAFGRNGTGKVGEPITVEPRQMSVEETFAVITFANVTGLDVLQEKMDQVREEFFPGTTPQFSATPAPAPAQEVSDKHEREMLEVIDERDRIHEWADQLADAIAKHTGYEIGEHTSGNNPWRMALNALVCHQACHEAKPAQEVGLTDEAVNDAAKVLAERFDYPWEHMPEEGRKNMRVQARAVVEAALRAKETK